MARWNSPLARGDTRLTRELDPLADSQQDRHLARIATERRDVPLDPLQRELLVQNPVVARDLAGRFGGECRMRHEAQGAEAIVDGDDDDALLHQLGRIVFVAFAQEQRPAMDPEHDRVVLLVVVGREYVEEQAILVQGAVAELRLAVGHSGRRTGSHRRSPTGFGEPAAAASAGRRPEGRRTEYQETGAWCGSNSAHPETCRRRPSPRLDRWPGQPGSSPARRAPQFRPKLRALERARHDMRAVVSFCSLVIGRFPGPGMDNHAGNGQSRSTSTGLSGKRTRDGKEPCARCLVLDAVHRH